MPSEKFQEDYNVNRNKSYIQKTVGHPEGQEKKINKAVIKNIKKLKKDYSFDTHSLVNNIR